jgi:hypothetical protein
VVGEKLEDLPGAWLLIYTWTVSVLADIESKLDH